MDDFSIESLYEMGLGLKANDVTSRVSVEDWDGDRDSLAYEMASAESMLDSMDIYSRISALNASQQINCAHRISANYGNCNRGIESFCNNAILSAESDAATAGADANADKKDAAKDEKNDEKKEAWYKKLFSVIKQFFKRIWQFICSIPRRIKAFVKRIIGKKENNSSSSNATSNNDGSSSSSSSSNNKQNQAALPERTGKLSDKELMTYNKSSPSSQTSQFVKSSANGQLKTSNGNQVQNKNSSSSNATSNSDGSSSSSSSSSNNSNTNSKLSENALQYKKNFEKLINNISDNSEKAIKDIEGSHNKLVSIIEKIEKSKTQDKKALSIFSNCCKIVSECYKIFVKGFHIFSSFCTDFLNNFSDDTLKDKSKRDAFHSTMNSKQHGKYLKIIIAQTCMIGENIKFSEYGNNNIKKEVYNGSAAVGGNDYEDRPIMNNASSFVKAVATYVQTFFNYNFTEAKDLNNELLRTNPDEFFRKLLSSTQKLKTDAIKMSDYMYYVYGVDVGEENIKKYLGGN